MSVTAASLVPALRSSLGTVRPPEALQLETEADVTAHLTALLSSALTRAETYTQRVIVGSGGEAEARVFATDWSSEVWVDDFSEPSLVEVDRTDDGTYDTTLTVDTDVISLPNNDAVKRSLLLRRAGAMSRWPRSRTGLRLTAKYGWPTLPDDAGRAIIQAAANLYIVDQQTRTSPLVQAGEFAVEFRDDRWFTPSVRMGLDAYRAMVFM
jgi:hypothetical protein